MLEWRGDRRNSVGGMPTAVKESEPTRGTVLGVVAFLRARAQDEDDAPLAAEATRVLQAAGRPVKAPVRGAIFSSRDTPGTPLAPLEDDEYEAMEDAIGDLWRSPLVTNIRQISEYIGTSPEWARSTTPHRRRRNALAEELDDILQLETAAMLLSPAAEAA